MMISPMVYNELHKDDTLEDLIKERNYLIKALKEFEKNKEELMKDAIIKPTPDMIYKMNLEYLSHLCFLIEQKV